MRKVFLSASLISKMDLEKPTKYISDDFDLGDKAYNFPMSYLIADNVENGDNIVITKTGISLLPIILLI